MAQPVGKRRRMELPVDLLPLCSLSKAEEWIRTILESGPHPRLTAGAAAELAGLNVESDSWFSLEAGARSFGLLEPASGDGLIEISEFGVKLVVATGRDEATALYWSAALRPEAFRRFLIHNAGRLIATEFDLRQSFGSLGVPQAHLKSVTRSLIETIEPTSLLRGTDHGFQVASQKLVKQALLRYPAPQDASRRVRADSGVERSSVGASRLDSAARSRAKFSSVVKVAEEGARSEELEAQERTIGQFLATGDVVDCYRLENRLGAGYSSVVWRATVVGQPPGVNLRLGQEVAVKFFKPEVLNAPDQVLRVGREFRVAQQVRHPNLIRVHEYLLASTRPHHAFLVMDLARGDSMSSLMQRGSLSTRQALAVTAQLLGALEALHGNDVLHRDVKPSNISVFKGQDDSVSSTLLDLGIVSVAQEGDLTGRSKFLGSKHWAPMEQLLGEPLGPRSDLYSAAAVAYSAITGNTPFSACRTEGAVVVGMQKSPLIVPLSSGVPRRVADVLNACLSIHPSERPASARECIEVFSQYVA